MARQQSRARAGRPAVIAALIAVSAALTAGPGFAVGTARGAGATSPGPSAVPAPAQAAAVAPGPSGPPRSLPSTPAASAPTAAAPRAERPAFGAFLGSGAAGVARVERFSRWLGGADVRVGHTYLPGDAWRNIEGAPDVLDPWARWRRERDNRMLVLNVPLQERNEEPVSDAQVRLLLRQGASGQFDQHFRALAARLVALGVPDTILVLGWEMNGTTYAHRCGPDPQAWKQYWNRIVTTMRSVPGQRFRFDFTPSRGLDAVPWTWCYPGDDTVDIIGMDAYDQPKGLSFAEQVTEPYGLQAHVDFAKSHNKPISYPEWGLFRNGDDADFMRGMLTWFDTHKPLYNTVTDYCPHGVWECAANPVSARIYRYAYFGRTAVTASSAAPIRPTTTGVLLPTAGCPPLDLDYWIEYWLGGGPCLARRTPA
ncbi:glycosyl hydrolase [Streptomyces sp. NPDC004542]|uniref:glycoside hydrolase family 26 protein n=1 Tax=Streptomyces sp. NPDC004542 TaxID=3154281 RepID=UPI0033B2D1C9